MKKDLVIIGGGSAGLAAAVSAYDNGVKDILILEKDKALGGILNQCIHNGFGLHEFKEQLSGPEFAYRFIKQVEERNKLIKEKPLYGRIVCRCEQISEQEIRDLFTRSFVPTSVKAIKKRVRAGFGKCQGGMCQPLVVKILIDELKLDPLKVRYDGNSSEILKYDLKEDR